ncbi:MAG: putative Ig domain-containing protein [Nitrospiraceae bacterium]
MKSIASVLSIIALGFGLIGCPNSGGGGGGSTQAFAVSTTAADFGVVGNAYTSTLAVTGGTAPFTWTLFGGVLPTGSPALSLDANTGVVSGTPDAAGNFTADFIVTDSTGQTATGSVLFAIHPRTDRVSVNGSGTAGSGVSSIPSISGDGSLIAFISQSVNFVTGVGGTQIYVHNRQTNQIEVISRDSDTTVVNEGDGISSDPAISASGRYVTFVSQSGNLVPGVSGQQVYLRDRQTDQTTLVSKSSSGITSNGLVNSSPAISEDGRFIAFLSNGTNVVTGVTGQQIYLHDRVTGSTSLISKNNNVPPVPGDGNSVTPAISTDGSSIVFASVATNLGTAGGNQQIYVHDRLIGVNGTTSLISKDSSATAGNGNSSTPSVSGNGRFVAFVSGATNIVAGFTGQQVYVHDRNTGANGTNSLISRDNSGTPNAGDQNSSVPSISSSGRYVAFASLATNLETGVSGQQIYLHDRNGPTTSLVSRDNTGSLVEGNAPSDTPSINDNGGFVAFASQATNLVAGGGAHVYIRAMP